MKYFRLRDKLKPAGVFLIAALCCTLIPQSGFCSAEPAGETGASEQTVKNVLPAEPEAGYRMIYENNTLSLYADPDGEHRGTFSVKNKQDGTIWYSNPVNSETDTVTINPLLLKSLITITCYDPDSGTLVTLNSFTDSVDQGGLQLQALKKGVRFNFKFPAASIMVPVTILLNDDGSMSAKVAVDKIEESGTYRLFSISLLPYFCAASVTDKGFILVPDGSGAVMNLNNGKTGYNFYNQPVYGGDAGEITDTKSETVQRIHMPVFGLIRNNSGIFTIIGQGAAQSTVSAIVSGVDSSYNAVWNSFDLRKVTAYSLEEGWQGKKTFNVYQETNPAISTIENRYIFLSGEKASLSGMAETYRKILQESGMKENNPENSVYIDYLGAVTRKKSVFGFPMNKKMTATSYEEALQITRELSDRDIKHLNIRYLEWDRLSIGQKILSKAQAESKLGGKSSFLGLAEYMKKNGIGFYPDADLIRYTNLSFPFQQYLTATGNMNGQINRYYQYKRNLFTKDTKKPSYYLLNYKTLSKSMGSYLASYQKLDIPGLSLSGMTSLITSDYSDSKKPYELWEGATKYDETVKKLSESLESLLLDDPNVSTAIYADHIVNLPSDSAFDMCDYGVPFYQMVLSGQIAYTGESINFSPDPRLAFLKALSTGSSLHYSLTFHGESDIVKNTEYDQWIGTDYRLWLPVIKDQYDEMNRVYGELGSRVLKNYIDAGNHVVKSVFDGGGELWVNFGSQDAAIGDTVIPAKSYVIRKGGDGLE